ncbi:MAG: YmdB family metallophosphoesterase [Treponema sp.]|jgi:metallophosphoesterase (TIGR00282 family)|nr:YmdB family metallophosphoesterase [Treponema sp.]
MRILYLAELVGKAGIYALKQALPPLKARLRPDFTIVCANGATNGNGLGRQHAAYIRKLGADAITTGDCCFYKKDLVENMEKIPYVLRPWNLDPDSPGRGARVFRCVPGRVDGETAAKNARVAVAVLLGRNGNGRLQGSNPFTALDEVVKLRGETPFVIVDFHAWASGEKRSLFAAAAGRCTAVIGSHNRVQTADEQVMNGTAVICDAGRSGSAESVGGCEIPSRIRGYLTGIPDWTREAWDRIQLQGVLIEAGDDGNALDITRICEQVPAPAGGDTAPF